MSRSVERESGYGRLVEPRTQACAFVKPQGGGKFTDGPGQEGEACKTRESFLHLYFL